MPERPMVGLDLSKVLRTGIGPTGDTKTDSGLIIPGHVDVFEPLIVKDSLTRIRNINTPAPEFRQFSDVIFRALGIRLFEQLGSMQERIVTPVSPMEAPRAISARKLLLGILRSGYPAAEGINWAMPDATRAYIDLKRDEHTARPVDKYNGLVNAATLQPHDLSGFDIAFVPDPMLATGGSAINAIRKLKDTGIRNIHFAALVAAPEGIENLLSAHPDIQITVCAIDEGLTPNAFIRPGLGDFGDRYLEGMDLVVDDQLNHALLRYTGTNLSVEHYPVANQ